MMKNIYRALNAIIVVLLFSSCATIVSKSNYDVRVNSNPKDATVTIFNRKGLEVFSGKTPCHVMLKPGAGYFKKAVYSIEFTKIGYADHKITLNADINGWYFGNLLLGGVIGFLIVDPATGAMYKLNNTDINASLSPINASEMNNKSSITLYALNDIPKEWRNKLIRISEY